MTDFRRALGDALGPLYRIEREVRPAGDCRQFVARELPTGPDLLVKVLPGALSLTIEVTAFERELILLADRLRHPNLMAPRGAGRAASFVYHTRPFADGTTLWAVLDRNGALPLARAVAILRDVLSALAHVHEAGLVHGDLKPENVILTTAGALVVDTGIVSALERSLTRGGFGAVSPAVRAPVYVPPEHRNNGIAAGPRDDMFGVGILAHEMLAGQPPAAESIEESRSLPPWLGELMRRCLAKDPVARWAHAGEALESVPPKA